MIFFLGKECIGGILLIKESDTKMICYNLNKDCNCQSCSDKRKSVDVHKKHIPGKRCKDHNQCPDCCYIVFMIKVLKHFGGACNKNKKCPVCNWEVTPGHQHNVHFYGRKNVLVKFQKKLLYEYLGIGFNELPWKF